MGLKSSLKFLLPKKYKTGRSLVCGCGCDVVCRCNNEKSIWSEIAGQLLIVIGSKSKRGDKTQNRARFYELRITAAAWGR